VSGKRLVLRAVVDDLAPLSVLPPDQRAIERIAHRIYLKPTGRRTEADGCGLIRSFPLPSRRTASSAIFSRRSTSSGRIASVVVEFFEDDRKESPHRLLIHLPFPAAFSSHQQESPSWNQNIGRSITSSKRRLERFFLSFPLKCSERSLSARSSSSSSSRSPRSKWRPKNARRIRTAARGRAAMAPTGSARGTTVCG
jgi:hypothetical protein